MNNKILKFSLIIAIFIFLNGCGSSGGSSDDEQLMSEQEEVNPEAEGDLSDASPDDSTPTQQGSQSNSGSSNNQSNQQDSSHQNVVFPLYAGIWVGNHSVVLDTCGGGELDTGFFHTINQMNSSITIESLDTLTGRINQNNIHSFSASGSSGCIRRTISYTINPNDINQATSVETRVDFCGSCETVHRGSGRKLN